MSKYVKSDTCVFCSRELYNRAKDGYFMCYHCSSALEDELQNLLKSKSSFANQIREVKVVTKSTFGESNKTLCIKIEMQKWSNTYVKIPTSKILEIRDLNNEELLFEYIEAEMKVQYALSWNKYMVPILQQLESNSIILS